MNLRDVLAPLPHSLGAVVYECPKCEAKLALWNDADPGESMAEIARFQATHDCRRVIAQPPPYVFDPLCSCVACKAEAAKR